MFGDGIIESQTQNATVCNGLVYTVTFQRHLSHIVNHCAIHPLMCSQARNSEGHWNVWSLNTLHFKSHVSRIKVAMAKHHCIQTKTSAEGINGFASSSVCHDWIFIVQCRTVHGWTESISRYHTLASALESQCRTQHIQQTTTQPDFPNNTAEVDCIQQVYRQRVYKKYGEVAINHLRAQCRAEICELTSTAQT